MRTLSSTLLSTQRAASRVPYLKIAASNRQAGVLRLQWQRLYQGAEPDHHHALCLPADGSLICVRVGPGEDESKLYRQRVVSPAPGSDFSAWTYIGQYGCQAVAAACGGAEVNIFWVNYDRELKHMQSGDYGVTWATAETLDYAPYALVPGISAAYKPNGDVAVFFANANDLYVEKRTGGSWQDRCAWDKTTGEITSVAAVYDGDWKLIVTGRDTSGNRKVWSLMHGDGAEIPAGEWSDLKEMASAPAGGNYEYGAAFMDCPDIYRVFYVEKFNGTEPYGRPCWSHSIPSVSFLSGPWREPVPFNLACEYGVAIAHRGNYCWLSTPGGVWRASLVEQSLDLTADVLNARVESHYADGNLTIELRNEDGKYNAPGTGNVAVLDTGCQLDASPGYLTAAGNEVSSGPAFWLESYEHVSADGKASLILRAVDGWRLLSGWRARHQFRWNKNAQERSVKEIMEFVLARVGLRLAVRSQSEVVTGFCPDFTIHAGDTGTAIMERLLSFVPDVVFIEGVMAYLVNPQSTDVSVYSYGTAHAVIKGRYGAGVTGMGQVRVEGWDGVGGNPVSADSFDWQQLEKHPEGFLHIEDRNISTVSQSQARGGAILRKASIGAINGIVRVPVNCGQQMYDVIDITDAGAGLTAAKRRVAGMEISYRPGRGEYIQEILLGGL